MGEPLQRRIENVMPGGENKQPKGYTIVEVMIVLAVSAVMFLIAATFINGKQEKASFTAGVDGMASELQDVIEQVTDGQYSDIPLTCPPPKVSTSAQLQGSNSGCVFRGKMIHFYTGPDHLIDQYEVVSLAADMDDTNPLGSGNGSTVAGIEGLTAQQTVPQALYIGPGGVSGGSYNVAILQSPGQVNNGVYQSGAQSILLASSSAPSSTPPLPSLVGNESTIKGTTMTPESKVSICLTDGTQYADVLIGEDSAGTSSSLTVSVQMKGTTAC